MTESTADDQPDLQDLPIHELRRIWSEEHPDQRLPGNIGKDKIIAAILSGSLPKKKKEIKRAPVLVAREKSSVPIIPKEIESDLAALAKLGLEWRIDEATSSVEFRFSSGLTEAEIMTLPDGQRSVRHRPIYHTACANLDQPAHHILRAAKECFPMARPVEMSRGQRHAQLD